MDDGAAIVGRTRGGAGRAADGMIKLQLARTDDQTNKIIKPKRSWKKKKTIYSSAKGMCCGFWPEITIEERRRLQSEHQLINTAGVAFYEGAQTLYSPSINNV